jgi:murein L,D-transpeptidase YafK
MAQSKRKSEWPIIICSGLLWFWSFLAGPTPAAASKQDTATLDPRLQRFSVDREQRLAEEGLRHGNPVMIRIFKKEAQLELWMQRHGRFVLFETYPICAWSGKLGPKIREGDRQSPEGLYRVDIHQLRKTGRNARSFYIDYPNALDRALGRTGSAIMVHGHCKSIGCFAMTNSRMEEIYALVEHALSEGQDHIEVQVFPFRMTEANLAANFRSQWYQFWLNLKEGYDLFEETRIPPKVSVCAGKYEFDAGELPGGAATILDVETLVNRRTCEAEPNTASPTTVATGSKPARVVKKRSPSIARRNTRKAYTAAHRSRTKISARRVHASGSFRRTWRQRGSTGSARFATSSDASTDCKHADTVLPG